MSSFVTATWKFFLSLGLFYALNAQASNEFCGQVTLDEADFSASGDEVRVFQIQNSVGHKIKFFTEVDLLLAQDSSAHPSFLRQLRWAKKSGSSICVEGSRLLSDTAENALLVTSIKNSYTENTNPSISKSRMPIVATDWSLEEGNKNRIPSAQDVKILLK